MRVTASCLALLLVLCCRVDIGITDCTNRTEEVSDFKLITIIKIILLNVDHVSMVKFA